MSAVQMRAAVYRRHGPAPEVLRIEDVPRPDPLPGEVRVRIRVSGVNPTDWKARSGWSGPMTVPFVIPNQDGAGVIDAVGEGVDHSRIGQRVWVYHAAYKRSQGTAAEYSCVPAERAVDLPESVSFDFGASVGIPAMTAHRTLFTGGDPGGELILVAGGAGQVGHFAIQLAKRAGAQVLATVSSPEKAALARTAGADEVFYYRQPGAADRIRERAPDGVDRIIELAPSANAQLDAAVLRPNGTIVIYAADQKELRLGTQALMAKNATLRFILIYSIPEPDKAAAARAVQDALAAGVLTPLPVTRFALDQIAAAHDAVERGLLGKALVDVP
ncbi:MAG: NADPH:quinone reductase [Candidatus Dormibacteraceae bacterium]